LHRLQYCFTQTAISLVVALYQEENICTDNIISPFSDISPTLALLEGIGRADAPTELSTNMSPAYAAAPRLRRSVSDFHSPERRRSSFFQAEDAAPATGLQDERVCLLSLLDDDTRYSERAQRREGPEGTRDEKFVKKLIETLGQQPGFVTRDGRRWDAANGEWVHMEGIDRKSLSSAHFAIAHFGAIVPYDAESFCEKNADNFDSELLNLMLGERGSPATAKAKSAQMLSPASAAAPLPPPRRRMTHDALQGSTAISPGGGSNAAFVRQLFSQPTSSHRSISFKVRPTLLTCPPAD
jgi:hypothetical protein